MVHALVYHSGRVSLTPFHVSPRVLHEPRDPIEWLCQFETHVRNLSDERKSMGGEFLGNAGRVLEDSFFQQKNAELLNDFREHVGKLERKEQLADASGIHDDAVLDRLAALNIRPETLAALALVPFVEVAWADGKVQEKEHAAVMTAAEHAGIHQDDDAFALLDDWLNHRPAPGMLDAWKGYVVKLCEALDEQAADRLKHDLLDRARNVAQEKCGFLGFGKGLNPADAAMLDELERAFD